MYNKDEFIRNIKNTPYYEQLCQWVMFYSCNDDEEKIKDRFCSFQGDKMGLYLQEAAKFYTQLKCYKPEHLSVNEHGAFLDGSVYDFKPLTNICILGCSM